MSNEPRRMKARKVFVPASLEKRLADRIRSLKRRIVSKFVDLENFIDPPEYNGPTPVHTVGSPDPRTFTRRSIIPNGSDTKVYITDIGSDLKEAVEITNKASLMFHRPIGNIYSIDFGSFGNGTVTFIVFDGMEEIERFLGKKKRLILSWSNEYGREAILADKIVQFKDRYVWGINVEDLVIEVYLDFDEEKDLRRCKESE